MKNILLISLTFFSFLSFSQEKYISRNGQIQFIASTPLETIDPVNNHVSCILDTENGKIVFQLKMISFKFEKALMEEHFNEKYVESDKFPKSTFVGQIQNWDNFTWNGIEQDVVVKGKITIHGIEKEIIAKGVIEASKSTISLSSSFDIIILDFGIKIPRLVRDKISETVKVEVNLTLKQK
jgi:polyisoprenoid-binding protein YceI